MLTLQVLELLGWQKVAYVIGEGTMIGGRGQTAGKNKAMFQSLQAGEMRAGVLSCQHQSCWGRTELRAHEHDNIHGALYHRNYTNTSERYGMPL